MIIRYLKELQDGQDLKKEERVKMAKEVLSEADEALAKAVEIVENQLNYQPVSILGVPMNPMLLLTLCVAVGTLAWNFISTNLFT